MHHTPLPARLLRQRLLSLLDAMPAAASGDVTSVHRARVASRRLREVLPVLAEAAGSDALDRAGRQVRRITRALGPIRELDVALGHLDEVGVRAGVSPRALDLVRRHLADQRKAHRRAMLDVITPTTLGKLKARLHHRSESHGDRADHEAERESARRRCGLRALSLAAAVEHAGHLYVAERLHTVRVATKKLRYGLEVERELTRSRATARINRLKHLQDSLGQIHDFEILAEHVRIVQGGLASSDRLAVAELDLLLRTLEAACREGHAAFLRERAAIVDLAERVAEAARDGRVTLVH